MSKPDRDNPVGIIGLGLMGGAIGRNLVADGWRVIGHDIDAARCAEAGRPASKSRRGRRSSPSAHPISS